MEMLVVISIISLLISLTLPAFQEAKRSARAAECLSNLRQLQIAQTAYADEYEGHVKPLSHALGDYWHHSLGEYLGDPAYKVNPNRGQWRRPPMKVLACPQVTRDPVGGFGSVDIAWSWGGGGQGGYGANLWVFPKYREYDNDWRFPRPNFYRLLETVDRPSDVPLFGDSNWVGSWPDSVGTVPPSLYWGYAVHEIGYFMGRFSIDRHHHTVQLVYVDSSARRVRLGELWLQRWHGNYQPANVNVP